MEHPCIEEGYMKGKALLNKFESDTYNFINKNSFKPTSTKTKFHPFGILTLKEKNEIAAQLSFFHEKCSKFIESIKNYRRIIQETTNH